MNDNRLIANTLGNNNRGGDPDAGVSRTADVLIFSAVVPITGTIISGNWLSDAHFGIWTQNAHASLSRNHSTTSWCTSTKARRARWRTAGKPPTARRPSAHVRQWSGSQHWEPSIPVSAQVGGGSSSAPNWH